MSKTVDLSLSLRTKQYLIAASVSGFFAVPVFGAVLAATGLPTGVALAGGVVGWLLLTVLWVRRLGGEADGGTWDAIPNWQYNGRFAGAGGLAREEQEDALGHPGDEQK